MATMRDDDTAERPAPAGLLVGLGLSTGLAGLVASSCCLVPLALFGLGVSSASLGHLVLLAALRPYLLAVAAVALALGWFALWRGRTRPSCGSADCAVVPAARGRTRLLLSVGTAVVALALVWDRLVEPRLLPLFW